MTERDFIYWLQGFAELNGDTPPNEAQWKAVREHIALVLTKVTAPVNALPHVGIPQWNPNTTAAPAMQRLQTLC